MTWDRRLYFLPEGRRAEDFFALKNPTASAGFEPANLGTTGQHATPSLVLKGGGGEVSSVEKKILPTLFRNCNTGWGGGGRTSY
jgi:hypothetical protein